MTQPIGTDTSFARLIISARPDLIGVRSVGGDNPGYEFLTYNAALGCPYYLSHGDPKWEFEWDRELHAYVLRGAKETAPQDLRAENEHIQHYWHKKLETAQKDLTDAIKDFARERDGKDALIAELKARVAELEG